MKINMKRMLHDFQEVVKFNKTPQKGYTRFSYSEEDKGARSYVLSQLNQLGLSVKVDAIGNIRAKYGPTDQPSIMVGSHIDTVESGGRFDGLTGVLAGLEIIRTVKEQKVELSHPIELVIFAEEEGSNFGIPMLGSKVLTGKYTAEELKTITNDKGTSVYDMAKNFGLSIENLEKDVLQPNEASAMIELHIEQGAVLETQKKSIGVVGAIAGMHSYKVTLEGDSNHAGTTPMELRRDPVVGAALIIAHVQQAAKTLALPTTVATVGKLFSHPNMHNVIAEKVEFFIDVRDVEQTGIEMIAKEIEKKAVEVSKEHSLLCQIELIGKSDIVELSSRIVHTIEEKAKERNFRYLKMNSGAVHDAAMLAGRTDVGMIFVPSRGGKSHSPDEYTSEQEIEAGCNLLLDVVMELAAAKKEAEKVLK